MAKREFLHKRTNNRIDKPLTAVKIAKVPDEVSERVSNQSLDIVRYDMLVCVEKGIYDDFKNWELVLKPFQNTECCIKVLVHESKRFNVQGT